MSRALVWLTQDLRLHDNPTLSIAHSQSQQVMHVFFLSDALLPAPSGMGSVGTTGRHRRRFLLQGLQSLRQQLLEYGHDVLVLDGRARAELPAIIAQYQIDQVYRSQLPAAYERSDWAAVQQQCRLTGFTEVSSCSLFQQAQLPFSLQQLPRQFTPFRKKMASITPRAMVDRVAMAAPLALDHPQHPEMQTTISPQDADSPYVGGETAGLKHLSSYFASTLPSRYKQTRNALQGFTNSTRFSPWLAQGSLSACQVVSALHKYEQAHGSNESTYWIYFELLWREFFFWTAYTQGATLFHKRGRRPEAPLTSFYADRFSQWLHGTSPWPIVNACMHELAETGYMSNRGRQLVASCLVNELLLDWRYGAAYFEQQLIDYDVGSNWGNWQYLAGVGADPRGKRRFDLAKQAKLYDPDGSFIERWQGAKQCLPVETRDASDWPLETDSSS